MNNSFFKAQLISMKKISVLVFTDIPRPHETVFTLYTNGVRPIKLDIAKVVSSGATNLYELNLPESIDFSNRYSISVTDFPTQPLDVSQAVYFPEFDNLFNYDGDDLGAIYTKEQTKFNLWAPLAQDVVLKLENKDGLFDLLPMERTDYGVFRITVNGDLLNRKYNYLVNNSGSIRESTDPYGKGTSLNSLFSAVVDVDAIRNMKKIIPTKKIEKPVSSIIYETNVRDFTEDKHTNIVNKGKYLGFVEEGRTTDGGNPAGLDYLKYIGVTHIQFNPIIDFRGVKDNDPLPTYNWGYDPISFFAIEGSFATHPEVAMNRLYEFREMVDKLHQNNIRVVMDVVYNHVYGYMESCFEKVVPNYFFRRRKDGGIASASGCGDDFASERFMASKAIVDSIEYFSDVFDVDGFRFDLMGLIDIKTINNCVKVCKKYKKDAIIYGEGWNMGYELPFEEKACRENAHLMPQVGFFNDLYRDIVKGPTFDKYKQGYISGDVNCSTGLEFSVSGSVLNYTFKPMFKSASQSINYIECHDNDTLFDKLVMCCADEDEETKLKRVKLANTIVLLSFGVPFIHMGQEFGQTKNGQDNTYNVPKINNMDWKMVDKRFEYVRYFKEIMRFRINNLYLSNIDDPNTIDQIISFDQHYGEHTFYSHLNDPSNTSPFEDIIMIINPNTYEVEVNLNDTYELIVCGAGSPLGKQQILISNYKLAPLTLTMAGRRRK